MREFLKEFYDEWNEQQERMPCMIREKIVSSCVCVIIPNLTHNQQPYAFIENVITDENFRKRGLATQCLNFAKEIAHSEDKTAFIQWV